MKLLPAPADFERLARRGGLVPVCADFLADTLTPILAAARLAAGSEYAFLLESVERGERLGRYSFLGAGPFLTFRSDLRECVTTDAAGKPERKVVANPLDELERLTARFRPAAGFEELARLIPGLPRFTGGAVGYAAYDAVRLVERLPAPPPRSLGLPDLYFGFYDRLVIFDHVRNLVRLVCHVDPAGFGSLEAAYRAGGERLAELAARLTAPGDDPRAVAGLTGPVELDLAPPAVPESNFTREAYQAAVLKCQEYIRAGDIIQVVPSQRLHTRTKVEPFLIYRALRVVNPSPYMFYLQFPDLTLVGSSPEVMVRQEGKTVMLRPIAGTRPRGGSPEADAALAAELLADPKERAEHVMLLDLGRNDVGRVSAYGSVRIERNMEVEYYSHVMHIVSQVAGTLAEKRTAFDTLRACLPAGTVSGAPKIRAMEIINELEPDRRGPYAGAVGYFDFHGNMDTCIAIRTFVIPGRRGDLERDVYVQAGGGVVADSVPENEYQETLNKARGLLKALELAGRLKG